MESGESFAASDRELRDMPEAADRSAQGVSAPRYDSTTKEECDPSADAGQARDFSAAPAPALAHRGLPARARVWEPSPVSRAAGVRSKQNASAAQRAGHSGRQRTPPAESPASAHRRLKSPPPSAC